VLSLAMASHATSLNLMIYYPIYCPVERSLKNYYPSNSPIEERPLQALIRDLNYKRRGLHNIRARIGLSFQVRSFKELKSPL
jgi:hypothetical protein